VRQFDVTPEPEFHNLSSTTGKVVGSREQVGTAISSLSRVVSRCAGVKRAELRFDVRIGLK
jgi:hypothetical protein